MKTLLVIAAVFAVSTIAMSLILFVGMRGRAKEGRKVPMFLLSLLLAATAVVIVGAGLRSLPEKKIVPVCALGLAWGFGFYAPLAFIARKYLAPLVAKTNPNEERA